MAEVLREEGYRASCDVVCAEEYGVELRPIGFVESSLVNVADAPNQGDEGAPDAWLMFDGDVEEVMRDLKVGEEIMVITWFDRARRDALSTYPGSDPTGPVLGVFSLRSPERPNPLGLHRGSDHRHRRPSGPVRNLEAVHGTPIVDVKTVLNRQER